MSADNWIKKFFDDSFYNPAESGAVAAAHGEAAFIIKAAGLKKGMAMLDLCCGPGRHSVEFAAKGMNVCGLDITPAYIKQAKARAKEAGVSVAFEVGDMRQLPYKDGSFDAVVCLFTSFGYFARFSDDMRVLKEVRRVLKPGGKFVLDVVDKKWLLGNMGARNWHELDDGGVMLEDIQYHPAKSLLLNRWIRIYPDGTRRETPFTLRLYGRREMRAALEHAGFRPLKFYGTLGGDEENRLVTVARR